jgi:general secretion pathway protein A
MYREYFGLKENPFSIAPDPRYFYMSEGHREALAHLLYGLKIDSGFIMLTGEIGAGKTLLCRCLFAEIPEDTDTAFILNPKVTAEELLANICDEFDIAYPEHNQSNSVFVTAIYRFLLETLKRNRRALLILEEAQNLSPDVLEQIRLLTNMETSQRKLLQIIMVGQPELMDVIEKSELRQLAQRITARYHLGPLSQKEVGEYVQHRLRIAGWTRGTLFPENTIKLLYRLTGGIPRLINIICDRAMIGAFSQNKDVIDKKTLKIAAAEVMGRRRKKENKAMWYGGAALVSGVLLFVIALVIYFFPSAVGDRQNRIRWTEHHVSGQSVPNLPMHTETRDVLAFSSENETQSLSSAYESLFRVWNLSFDPSGQVPAGQQAQAHGMSLIESKGTLADLRLINKPVVLKLQRPQNKKFFYATLLSLHDNQAQIAFANRIERLSIFDIVVLWNGEYSFLWRPPAEYKRKLRLGQTGAMVEWIDRTLAQVQSQPATGKKVYGPPLSDRVKEFQGNVGLNPDGVVGPMTIAYIQGMLGDDHPALTDKRGKN